MDVVTIGLAAAPAVALSLGLVQRISSGRGIGTQFIRFVAIATVVPVAGILAMRGMIGSDVVAGLLGAALGYAFGRVDQRRDG